MFNETIVSLLVSYWFWDVLQSFNEFGALRLVNKMWCETLTRAFIADINSRGVFLRKYIERDPQNSGKLLLWHAHV